MLKGKFIYTPPAALTGSLRDYRRARGADLQARIEGFSKWRNLRRQHGLWSFSRVRHERPSSEIAVQEGADGRVQGLNFACEDHLGLASHPAVEAAAREAIGSFGVHSAGAAAQFGGTALSVELERRIADFLGAPEAALFPSGWAAAYGAVKALARSSDHVILDAQAPAGLKEGAAAATRNLYLFHRNRVDECRQWLEKIRSQDAENGVVVATETLSASECDAAEIRALQALCHEFNATLVVHAAHDLGALGPEGKGVLGEQDMLGKVDVVTGSLARTFASNGGFVACRSAEMTEYVRAFSSSWTQSSALSPAQAAAALQAFDIVESAEGEKLREKLRSNVASLRGKLAEAGLEPLGGPAPMVCAKMGTEALARLVARRLPDVGLIANLVEFPDAPRDQARVRLHVMASHSPANIRDAAAALAEAWQAGCDESEWLNSEREKLRASA